MTHTRIVYEDKASGRAFQLLYRNSCNHRPWRVMSIQTGRSEATSGSPLS